MLIALKAAHYAGVKVHIVWLYLRFVMLRQYKLTRQRLLRVAVNGYYVLQSSRICNRGNIYIIRNHMAFSQSRLVV
jgi:hypothetical protein